MSAHGRLRVWVWGWAFKLRLGLGASDLGLKTCRFTSWLIVGKRGIESLDTIFPHSLLTTSMFRSRACMWLHQKFEELAPRLTVGSRLEGPEGFKTLALTALYLQFLVKENKEDNILLHIADSTRPLKLLLLLLLTKWFSDVSSATLLRI